MFKCIISSHLNPTLSGVAKFNLILAKYLNIPCVGFSDIKQYLTEGDEMLLSVKLKDINGEDRIMEIKEFLKMSKKKNIKLSVFFHTFNELPEEYDILAQSQKVFCANSEIKAALNGFDKSLIVVWCPHLIDLSASIHETKFNILSFGMAHKLQLKYYRMLFNKLKDNNIKYALWVSTAFHEKANFGDFNNISNQLTTIFGNKIQFLGFLSDEAINYFIDRVQLFVGFFPKGVRANNTSIYVPMERGCPVLTNLDNYSPRWMQGGTNILNINDVKTECFKKSFLHKISLKAKQDVKKHASWKSLVNLIKSEYN